jgi:hypothetical protein
MTDSDDALARIALAVFLVDCPDGVDAEDFVLSSYTASQQALARKRAHAAVGAFKLEELRAAPTASSPA